MNLDKVPVGCIWLALVVITWVLVAAIGWGAWMLTQALLVWMAGL